MRKIEKYAELVMKTGLNIQERQNVLITSPIETAEFARLAMQAAYDLGARKVKIKWTDEESTRISLIHSDDDVFEKCPDSIIKEYQEYVDEKTALLSISASDPEALKGVDPERLMKNQRVMGQALRFFQEKAMANELAWCVVSVPTEKWAKKVFNGSEDAVDQMWEAIYNACRIDTVNPIEAWEKHLEDLSRRSKFMNDANFKSLHFKNSRGTDLEIQLVENHIWAGGAENTVDGTRFVANLPTEEIFTMPKADGVNGIVYSSKPLIYNGNIIDEFHLVFENGKVIDYKANVGEEFLSKMLEVDEGAKRLGEVALVQYDSPISNANILFMNTLFDENASCHLALGRAYPINLRESHTMLKEELQKAGANDSLIHEDFMIGTADLCVSAQKFDGTVIDIFKDGNFVI